MTICATFSSQFNLITNTLGVTQINVKVDIILIRLVHTRCYCWFTWGIVIFVFIKTVTMFLRNAIHWPHQSTFFHVNFSFIYRKWFKKSTLKLHVSVFKLFTRSKIIWSFPIIAVQANIFAIRVSTIIVCNASSLFRVLSFSHLAWPIDALSSINIFILSTSIITFILLSENFLVV